MTCAVYNFEIVNIPMETELENVQICLFWIFFFFLEIGDFITIPLEMYNSINSTRWMAFTAIAGIEGNENI